jgi:hypothetical protein
LCPIVRRTPELDALLALDLRHAVDQKVAHLDRSLLVRAVNYLYLKETRSSFEIEEEPLAADRSERFVALLEEVSRTDTLRPELLLRWQNELVEPRYAARSYRSDQAYVVDAAPVGRVGVVHYVAPKQNQGTLSATKRPQFAELTDEEISQMENLVREHLVESELNPVRRGT